MSGNAEIDVLAYVVGCFQQTGTSYVTGPVTTDQGLISGTPTHTDVLNPPPDTPGAAGYTQRPPPGGMSYPAVGARCRRAEWHFSPHLPVPMVRE